MQAATSAEAEDLGQQRLSDIANIIDTVFSGTTLDEEARRYTAMVTEAVVTLDTASRSALTTHYRYRAYAGDMPFSYFLYLYDVLGDIHFLNRINDYMSAIASPGDFYELYWNLTRRLFVCGGKTGHDAEPLRQLFHRLSQNLRTVFQDRGVLAKKRISEIRRVAILSPQVLGVHHSPTREAFSLSLHLERYHGLEVFVVNTNGMNYDNRLQIVDPFIANAIDAYEGLQRITFEYLDFEDAAVNLCSFPAERMSTKKLQDILFTLIELDIDAVIAHGENLFVQEMVLGCIPSLFATTGAVVPYAHSDAYWVPGHLLSEDTIAYARNLGHNDIMPRSMLATPEGLAQSALSRSSLGINEHSFVFVVVSTRLPAELTDGFVEACHIILTQTQASCIAFAGSPDFDIAAHFEPQWMKDNRVLNIGFQQDLPGVCKMADAYLNPYRQGGGTSAQTAMLNGLPVVTMDHGHISAIVAEGCRQPDWQAFVSYATRLASNTAFLKEESQKTLLYAAENISMKPQAAEIFAKLTRIKNTNYNPLATTDIAEIAKRGVLYQRQILNQLVSDQCKHVVKHGPFQGMQLMAESSWGADQAAKLLGFYEAEIFDDLCETVKDKHFVDIGAADGYYAVGLVFAGLARSSLAFEASEPGRSVLARTAKANGCDTRVTICGKADQSFIDQLEFPAEDTVFLIDIEGGEFDLLSTEVLERLDRATLFVEIHDFTKEARHSYDQLLNRARATHEVQIVKKQGRSPYDYPELDTLDDNAHWLVCSEGRAADAKWVKMKRKHPAESSRTD